MSYEAGCPKDVKLVVWKYEGGCLKTFLVDMRLVVWKIINIF